MTMHLPRGRRPVAPPPIAEHVVQEGIIEFLSFAAHPRLIYFHIPNGEDRNARVGAKLKRMGVLKGVADLALVLPGGQAAFLEVKARGGRQSPEQLAFQQRCQESGVAYAVAASLAEAMDVLAGWGALKTGVTL